MMQNQRIDYAVIASHNLRRLLKSKKITQEQFSEIMRCDTRTIGRWLQGGINRLDVLADIAFELGVSVGDLISSDDEVPLSFSKTGHSLPCFFFFRCFIIITEDERKVSVLICCVTIT